MAELRDWSTVADNNNQTPPDGWPEEMAYSAVNNTAREGMAVLARNYKDNSGELVTTGTSDALIVATYGDYPSFSDGDRISVTLHVNVNGGATLAVGDDNPAALPIQDRGGHPIQTGMLNQGTVVDLVFRQDAWRTHEIANFADIPVGSGFATGMVVPFAGSTPPLGFLLCDGSNVSRTLYTRLFEVIGTTYGAGDGFSTFNVPDLRARAVRGADDGDSPEVPLGATGGTANDTMPTHDHAAGALVTVEALDHTHNQGTYQTTEGGDHTHGNGTYATVLSADHMHGNGTLSARQNFHNHDASNANQNPQLAIADAGDHQHEAFDPDDPGSFDYLYSDAENAHTHPLDPIGGMPVSDVQVNHVHVIPTLTSADPSGDTEGFLYQTGFRNAAHEDSFPGGNHFHFLQGHGVQGGAHQHLIVGDTFNAGSHDHDISGSTGYALPSIFVSGSTADGGAHAHGLAGSSGEAGYHGHFVFGQSSGGGHHEHNVVGVTGFSGLPNGNWAPYLALNHIIKT